METTGTLTIRKRGEKETFAWNGNVEDRDRARKAFEKATARGGFLAVAFDSTTTRKGARVETFAEIEEIERERGVVVVEVTPGLVGG